MHRPIQTPAAACAVEVEEVVKLKRQLKRFQSEICVGGILLIRLVVPAPHVEVTVIHEKISGSYPRKLAEQFRTVSRASES